MDKLIKNSIDSRKNGIFNVYEVTDSSLLKEIDTLFCQMEKLGNSSKDLVDFETKLANSSLNQEYIDLFTKISKKSKYILKDSSDNNVSNNVVENTPKISREVNDLTLHSRRIAREETEKKLRNTPIIGDIMTVKQHADMFGKIKRAVSKKKEDQDEE